MPLEREALSEDQSEARQEGLCAFRITYPAAFAAVGRVRRRATRRFHPTREGRIETVKDVSKVEKIAPYVHQVRDHEITCTGRVALLERCEQSPVLALISESSLRRKAAFF